MVLRPHSFLVSGAVLSLSLATAVACSSGDSNEGTSSNATTSGNTSSTTSTVTSTATQTSATVGSTTVTSTATSTASATTGTNTTASGTTSTTASSSSNSSNSTTGGTTTGTGTGGGTSTGTDTSTSSGAGGTGGGPTEFTLTSPAFADDGTCSNEMPDTCELFPSENSSFVGNENPELNWTAGPEGTLSYALVFHDLSNGFGHWAIWGLSGETLSLPAALPGDATLTTPVEAQQTNASFADGNGYFGPGSCENVYEFKVYALNVEDFTPQMSMSPDQIQDELEGASSDIVLATATLRGRANPEDSTMPCN